MRKIKDPAKEISVNDFFKYLESGAPGSPAVEMP
jgi:hypothetical protein